MFVDAKAPVLHQSSPAVSISTAFPAPSSYHRATSQHSKGTWRTLRECPFSAPLTGWSARDLNCGRKLKSASRLLGQEGVGNMVGGDRPGGPDMESWPQALPWETDLKEAEEENLFLLPHPCLSARGEGQLDEDNGGFSTGVTFGGFLGQERHQWQQAPLTHHSHGWGCIPNLCLEPLWQPRSGLPCSHYHQLPSPELTLGQSGQL